MDGRGFRRLRIVAAGVVGASVVPAAAPEAGAAEEFVPATYAATGSRWQVSTGLGAHNAAGATTVGYGLATAQRSGFTMGPTHTTFSNFVSVPFATAQSDAIATGGGAFLLIANGQTFRPPNFTLDVTGNTFTSSRRLAGLKVEHRFVFLGDLKAAVLFTFTNPSRTRTKKAEVVVASALGTSQVSNSESGDGTVTTDDAWFVGTPPDSDTPYLTLGRGDCHPDARNCAHPTIHEAPDNGNPSWVERYKFRIRPRRTKRLLFFIEMSKSAPADPGKYDSGASLGTEGLLAPFTAKERRQVVNWRSLP